jgi:hypothetical protein
MISDVVWLPCDLRWLSWRETRLRELESTQYLFSTLGFALKRPVVRCVCNITAVLSHQKWWYLPVVEVVVSAVGVVSLVVSEAVEVVLLVVSEAVEVVSLVVSEAVEVVLLVVVSKAVEVVFLLGCMCGCGGDYHCRRQKQQQQQVSTRRGADCSVDCCIETGKPSITLVVRYACTVSKPTCSEDSVRVTAEQRRSEECDENKGDVCVHACILAKST